MDNNANMASRYEHEIPEGYEARIEDNKVIIELKESKDERTRRELIGFLQDEIDSINHLVSGDYDDRDADDIAHQKWCEKVVAWLEKQGEKKPADLNEQYIAEVFERVGLAEMVRNLKNDDLTKALQSAMIELSKVEQKSAEWSDEDEISINEIIETLNIVQANRLRTQRTHYNKATIDKDIAFLKALKERCTWKPSDEQMIALKKTCDKHWEPDGLDPLYTLYQDLEKLKG